MEKKMCKNCKRLQYYDRYFCEKKGYTNLEDHCKYYKDRKRKFWLFERGDF